MMPGTLVACAAAVDPWSSLRGTNADRPAGELVVTLGDAIAEGGTFCVVLNFCACVSDGTLVSLVGLLEDSNVNEAWSCLPTEIQS